MKWIIVAFNHPDNSKSVIYRQNISEEQLIKTIYEAIGNGANLMSIRGFEEEEEDVH